MNKVEIFALLEKVYARRKKVADAKMRQLESSVRQFESQITELNSQVSSAITQFDGKMLELIKETKSTEHFHTFSSRIAAARLRHNDEVVLLRYDALKARENLEDVSDKRDRQKSATRSATQKTAKFDKLLSAETAAELLRQEATEEELTLEAQNSKRASNAG